MKIDFIIISAILVIISLLPFILFPLLINKMRKNLKNKFKEVATTLGLNISYELAWNTNLAGIDILKKQFMFVQNLNDEFLIQHVNLNKVQQVKLVTETREIKQQNIVTEILSRVHLEFLENNSAEPVYITLFDYDFNYTQDFEIKNAEKLVLELQKYVVSQPILKRTA